MEGPEYLTHICPSPYLFLRNHYEVSLLPSQKRDLCLGLYVGNKRDFWKLCVESTAIPSWMGPVSSENCVLHISMVCCVTPLLIMRKMWAVWQDYHLSVAGHRVINIWLYSPHGPSRTHWGWAEFRPCPEEGGATWMFPSACLDVGTSSPASCSLWHSQPLSAIDSCPGKGRAPSNKGMQVSSSSQLSGKMSQLYHVFPQAHPLSH